MIHETIITNDTENTQANTYPEHSIIWKTLMLDDDTSGLWIDDATINDEIQNLLTIGKTEIFEDGMDSKFSKYLTTLLSRYGNVARVAIEVISNLIASEQVSPPIAGEILKLLGDFEHPNLKRPVFDALIRGLNTRFVDIKDGAILGLASLDNPKAIPYLEKAIERETNLELKEDMQDVLEQLIETGGEND